MESCGFSRSYDKSLIERSGVLLKPLFSYIYDEKGQVFGIKINKTLAFDCNIQEMAIKKEHDIISFIVRENDKLRQEREERELLIAEQIGQSIFK